MFKTIGQAKKLIVAVVGFTVLLIGLALLFLPGPGIPLILIGIAILATEFVWAGSLLEKVKSKFQKTKEEKRGGNSLP
jgi:uncharacterized protein (TIGR02611 family)